VKCRLRSFEDKAGGRIIWNLNGGSIRRWERSQNEIHNLYLSTNIIRDKIEERKRGLIGWTTALEEMKFVQNFCRSHFEYPGINGSVMLQLSLD